MKTMVLICWETGKRVDWAKQVSKTLCFNQTFCLVYEFYSIDIKNNNYLYLLCFLSMKKMNDIRGAILYFKYLGNFHAKCTVGGHFISFLIYMVHGDKENICLTITNHANLKKACEFLFLELAGRSELTSSDCTVSGRIF